MHILIAFLKRKHKQKISIETRARADVYKHTVV